MRILIVDDHELVRDGLAAVLSTLAGPDGRPPALTQVGGFEAAIAAADAHADLSFILLDFRLPDVQGFAALVDLVERRPGVPVVVMSGNADAALMREALERGAMGFIPKSSPSAVIVNAVRLVLAGGRYLPPEMLEDSPAAPAAPAAAAAPDVASLGLTPRQGEVLALMLAGHSNKMICRALDLSEGTVKNHVAAILRALDVTTRVQAVVAAARRGVKL